MSEMSETSDTSDTLTIALISDLFFDAGAERRLRDRLAQARRLGAALAVLPELPLNEWSPATRQARDADAEPPLGPRHRMLAGSAAGEGIALLGGAIVREPADGRRFNTSLLFDGRGGLVHSYRKLHLPEEDGFWETSHYEAGDEPPRLATEIGLPLGVQLCSDVNRPEGTHVLAAMGAEAVLCPRATEAGTWARWRLILQANAITSSCYVLSVNRPRPEAGVPLGGPSVAISPEGAIILETSDPVAAITLSRDQVRQARRRYPGYLPVRADVYAEAWRRLTCRPS